MILPTLDTNDALFLDIDGTLIDLAPTPDAVIVPPGLPATLRQLGARLSGALAILSGRKLSDIDHLLEPGLACAAEHGMMIRTPDGVVTSQVQRPAGYAHWLKVFNRYAKEMPGLLVEEKEFSLVLHYRRAPEHEEELRNLVHQLLADSDDATLLPAHCAFELKPRGGNKGDALAGFMSITPFAGRRPIFIGDDVTDEPAIAKANELGGAGLHVKRDFGGNTEAVRDWLRRA
ncbi:MAG TPA: trehalose-phosphatase [Acidocella sp.]|uniref:trehalose-phosphatase n=1 Tax=Acidocella sp. TaxID=50710 RepID=UPI002C3B2E59|nr:trehalose-phosphatase [Acidocella sp.]HVE22929.1 trehalose-phosphatase [Acidocella sp.]